MASLAVLLLRRDATRATGAVFLTSRSSGGRRRHDHHSHHRHSYYSARLFQVAASAAPPAAALALAAASARTGEADCDDSYAAGGLPDSYAAGGLPDYWMQKQGEHAWLEEVLGEKALGWVKDENAKTVAALGNPAASPLYSRILGILTSKEKIPHVRKIGEFYYNFWVDSANPRGVLRRCTMEAYRAGHQGGAGTAWETVLDVDKLNAEEGENCK